MVVKKQFMGVALVVCLVMSGCSTPMNHDQGRSDSGVPASATQDAWSEQQKQDAIAVAAGTLGTFYGGAKDIASWREKLAARGTANFKAHVEGFDPSLRATASVTGVYSTDFSSADEAIVKLTSAYDDGQNNTPPVWVVTIKRENGQLLVEQLKHEPYRAPSARG